MKTIIQLSLVIAQFAFSAEQLIGYRCHCTELRMENECYQAQCKWITENQYCIESQLDCTSYYSQETCDQQSGCAWTNSSNCSQFTQCTDYTVSQPEDCYWKDISCIPGLKSSNESIQCVSGKVECSTITNPAICGRLMQNLYLRCWYHNSQCIYTKITTCSSIIDKILCRGIGCLWKGNKCQQMTCSDVPIQATCTAVRTDTLKEQQICIWKKNGCQNATDRSAYTADSCYMSTAGTSTWVNKTCIACTGQKIKMRERGIGIVNEENTCDYKFSFQSR